MTLRGGKPPVWPKAVILLAVCFFVLVLLFLYRLTGQEEENVSDVASGKKPEASREDSPMPVGAAGPVIAQTTEAGEKALPGQEQEHPETLLEKYIELSRKHVDPPKTPLEKYPGFRTGDDMRIDEEQYMEDERARQAYIAECMQKKAFLYHPEEGRLVEAGEMLSQEDIQEIMHDPNEDYLQQLGPGEREAWYMALVGVPDPYREDVDIDVENDGGCVGESLRKIPGVFAARIQLKEEYDRLEEKIKNDPEVVFARQERDRCLDAKGYLSAFPPGLDPKGSSERLSALLSDPEKSRILLEYGMEREMALKKCSPVLEQAEYAAAVRHEKRFIEQHRDVLEPVRQQYR